MSECVVVTGMSGAGRSTAANAFEDLGWLVIDNLPPQFIPQIVEFSRTSAMNDTRMVMAAGAGAFFDQLAPALQQLRELGVTTRVLFLDASNEVLVRRFEGTRRRHPLDDHGLADAIAKERAMLTTMKANADVVIDTTNLNVHQLRDRVVNIFSAEEQDTSMRTSIMSFGYKHGLPLDVDMVLDCRFLPNPHWDPDLRPLTGLDAKVRDFVLERPETIEFLARLEKLLELLLPAYIAEGKSYLTIAIGCTGGRHRSVAIAEALAERVRAQGFTPTVTHRDFEK